MGKIEHEAKIIRRRISIQKVLLRTVAAAGLLSVSLLAPNALQILKLVDGNKKRSKNPKYLIGTAFEKLLGGGMIEFVTTKNGKFVRLTESGKRKLGEAISRAPDSCKKKRWDKRWRVVIYDIREQRRSMRRRVQRTIQSFGFCMLQQSVWVYPYECEELIILLKANFKIGKDLLYMVVEKIENDAGLKNHFNLK